VVGNSELAELGADVGLEGGVVRGVKVEGGKRERGGTGAVVPLPVLGANLGGRVWRRLGVMQVVNFVSAVPGLVVEEIFAEATRLHTARRAEFTACGTTVSGVRCAACGVVCAVHVW